MPKPELIRLQSETFLLWRELMIHKGAPAAQLKPVRIITDDNQKKFFFAMTE